MDFGHFVGLYLDERYDALTVCHIDLALAAELGATVNQVVLAWLTGGNPSTLPVVGFSSVAQLDEAIAAMDLTLDPAHRARLDAIT